MAVFPPVHIVIGYSSQIVMHVKDALNGMKLRYPKLPSLITTITGPSRTADIEKTLILGAHGPKELYVFLLDKDISQ
jgi:L-lactate dehydrogenase complex protein LldG